MEEQSDEIVVTIRAKNIPELKRKLREMLGEEEPETTVQSEDFPDDIKRRYPDYQGREHSAAMLTVLYEKHKGRPNAVNSHDLAQEMLARFPRLFSGKTVGTVSRGNVPSGYALAKDDLIKMELVHDQNEDYDYRVYWV